MDNRARCTHSLLRVEKAVMVEQVRESSERVWSRSLESAVKRDDVEEAARSNSGWSTPPTQHHTTRQTNGKENKNTGK